MRTLLKFTILYSLVVTSIYAVEPKPFSCSSQSFVSFNIDSSPTTGDSKFDTISLLNGTRTLTESISEVNGVNSIGYNVNDNMIWGYNLGSNKVVRIDANKIATSYTVSGLASRFYVAADVDKNGVLYLFSRGNSTERSHIARVKLGTTPIGLSEVELVDEDNVNTAFEINTADFAFNLQDDKLYFIQKDTDMLYNIEFTADGSKGLVHEIGSLELGSVNPIINFFDNDGNFYFNKDTTSMYKVNVASSSNASPFSLLDNALINGDGARCANAGVEDSSSEASLIADYHFDECSWSGTTNEVQDSSANAFDGNILNGANTNINDGQVNGSGKFVEDNDAVKVEGITGLDSNNFTLSFWTKIDADNESTHELIKLENVNAQNSTNGNSGVVELRYRESDDELRISGEMKNLDGSVNGYSQTVTANLNDGLWHHIVVTYTNENMKIYVDTSDADMIHPTNGVSGVSNLGILDDFNGVLRIGNSIDGLFTTKAQLDEVKLYAGALDSDTISILHNNEKDHKNADATEREAIFCTTPFTCDGTMFFSNETELGSTIGTTGGMYLHSINKSKSPFSFDKIGEKYVDTYNALAYNPKDNYLYASYRDTLLKIDKDGNIEDLGAIAGLSTNQKYSATFDKDGYYYLGDWQDRATIYKIDVKTKTIVETMKLDTPLYFIDMTIEQNGSDKYLYILNRSESVETSNQLVKINISQIKSNGKYGYETIGDKVADEAEADSIFYDAAGKLYILFHKGGFYQIDITTGKRIPISSAPELANLNDGAVCPNATIKLQPTISFGDATVVEGNSGTSELTFPVSLINNSHPKSLTYTYRVYDGNNTNKSMNAKNEEDYQSVNYNTTIVQELAHDSEIKVTVNGDTKIEADEMLRLIVSEVTGALFMEKNAQGTIINDDNSNIFTAYDIADINKKIQTRIVKSDFILTLAKLDSHGNLISSEDENSTKVRIVESSKCSVPFDGNMGGFVSFDMGTNSDITSPIFNSSIAIKDAKIQFYWQDVLGEHTSCSNDTFSIRPDYYAVKVPTNIVAGKDFNITVEAMGSDNVVVSNYQELATVYALDINDTKGCALGSYSKNKTDFVGGVSTVTLNYSNIGKLKFKAIEQKLSNTEYANIDKDDNIDRFITTGESEKFINPAKIQAVFNFKTQNSLPFTYFSDNPYEMGALIEANITMLSASDTKVTNFSNSCWASDVDITIDYNHLKGTPLVASFSDEDNLTLGNIIHSNKVTYKITKDKFTDANAKKSIYLNFGRDIKTPQAPIQIKLSSPKVSLSSGLNTSVVKEKTYTFAYVRAHSAPEQSVVGDTIVAKVDYELYIPSGINKAEYGLTGLPLSDNGVTWYTLPIDDAFGYEKNPKLRYGNGAHISTFDKNSVTVHGLKTPYTNRVVYYPKDYLLYNKFSDKATSHSFKINLYSDTKQWSGKGRGGIVLDKDVSKNVVRKMNW